MLQHAWDQTDLLGRIHGDKGARRATEIVKTHGLSELLADACADDVVDAASRSEGALYRTPRARHDRCGRAGAAGSPSSSA